MKNWLKFRKVLKKTIRTKKEETMFSNSIPKFEIKATMKQEK